MLVLMNEYHTEFLGFVKQQITINRSVLQENGNFTWRVSDWWCHLWEYLGRNMLLTTLSIDGWGLCAPPHPSLFMFR